MRQRRRPVIAVAMMGVFALVLAACGGDDEGPQTTTGATSSATSAATTAATSGASGATTAATSGTTSSGDPQAEAAQLVQDATAKLTWSPPGPEFDAGNADLAGKTIYYITVQLNTPFTQYVVTGMTDAGKLFDVAVKAFDTGGDPAQATRLIEQATAQNADGIVIQGFQTSIITAPIKAATDAGIPVIMAFDVNDGGAPTEVQQQAGVFGNVDACWTCSGKLMADAAFAKYGDETNSFFITASILNTATEGFEAYEAELARLCESCPSDSVDIPIPQWATGIQPAVTTALSSNPDLNVVAPVYDLMFPAVSAAVSAAQLDGKVGMVSSDAILPGLQAMTKDPSILVDAGAPTEWMGWLAFDQWLRAMNDLPPAEDTVVSMRAFTPEVAKTLDLSENANETSWFTDVDLQSEFSKIWGVS
jgi:ABC-type sugar transport system substrate-binding protein